MKKILTLPTIFAGLLILLAPVSTLSQEQVAALASRGDGPRLETAGAAPLTAAEYRTRLKVLKKRQAALRRYLSSVSPDSADYNATKRSLADVGHKLDDTARNLVGLEFPSATTAPAVEAAPTSTTLAEPQTDSLSASLVTNDSDFAVILVDVTKFTGDKIKVESKNSKGEIVSSSIYDLRRSFTRFRVPNIKLADTGDTTITVSSLDGKVTTDVTVSAAQAEPTVTDDINEGGAVAYTLGGMVVSQQAQNFNQADPFMGFIAGYSSKTRGAGGPGAWRWNLRFQGIFTSSGRTAEETETSEGSEGGGGGEEEEPDPFKFIASRKTFDVDAHMWFDFFARNKFTIGPYIAWGASTVMDKNELSGEAVIVDKDNDGRPDDNQVVTESQSDNDLKQFREYGMLMNLTVGDRRDPALFMQAILAKGWYEALKDLDGTDDDTRNRFIGKLRVFPEGLNRFTKIMTPMFGVELNAGTGPDQVKFFTGFAVKLKGFGDPTGK